MGLSRLQKFKSLRKQKLVFISKLVVVFYLVIFSFSYLTGGTIAYFSESNKTAIHLTAGTWFDGSKLLFAGNNGTKVIQACPVVEISAVFKNIGNKMQGPAKYEIFYTESGSNGNGSPENHGSSIYEGEFRALEKDETITLTFAAEQKGFYVFKVYQREGFEGKENEGEIWSNKFNIQCKENKANVEEEEAISTDGEINEPSETDEQQESVVETEEQSNSNDTPTTDTEQQDSNENNNQTDEQEENTIENGTDKQGSSKEVITNTVNDEQSAGEGETNEETE